MTVLHPLRARTEFSDAQRATALAVALRRAEADLNLTDGEGLNMLERAQRILMAAMPGRLDPQLYAIAWFVRRTAGTKH